MSIANLALTSYPEVMNGISRLLVQEATTPREYEVMPRIAAALMRDAPNDVAADLGHLLRPFLDFDCLDIVAFDENTEEILWHNVSGRQLSPEDVPIEIWWVHQHQQLLCLVDSSGDDKFALRREALTNLERAYRSFCCIPVRTPRHRLGVLRVASLRPNNFSEEQVRFLYSVADQIAVAMSEMRSRERLRSAESQLQVNNARL